MSSLGSSSVDGFIADSIIQEKVECAWVEERMEEDGGKGRGQQGRSRSELQNATCGRSNVQSVSSSSSGGCIARSGSLVVDWAEKEKEGRRDEREGGRRGRASASIFVEDAIKWKGARADYELAHDGLWW